MLDWLRKSLVRLLGGKVITAKYDAAQTNADNRKHWANADALSAVGSNDPWTVKRLRERARYEYQNNGYCSGPVQTYAYHLLGGSGPSLDAKTDDDKANETIEAKWREWVEEVNLPLLIGTAAQAKVRDGDGIMLLGLNPNLESPVKLNVLLRESDQLESPLLTSRGDRRLIDGIEFDQYEQPTGYWFRRSHPGDPYQTWGASNEIDLIPAYRVIHWFRQDRPGQIRGASELAPSLPLFAQLRRFTLATLSAAETAASFAIMLESDIAADADEVTTIADFAEMEFTRNLMTKLPPGHKATQMAAEHPTTTHAMFVSQILKELGRGLHMPFNIFAGDSSQYNLSSARLDVLLFRLAMVFNRDQCRRIVLNRIFKWWLAFARLIPNYLPPIAQQPFKFDWKWPGFPSIDPLKDAQADTERLRNNTTTLEEIYSEMGKEWKQAVQQRGREVEELDANGVVFDETKNNPIDGTGDAGSGGTG